MAGCKSLLQQVVLLNERGFASVRAECCVLGLACFAGSLLGALVAKSFPSDRVPGSLVAGSLYTCIVQGT